MWRRFCAAIERPDLAADETFAANAGRVTNKPALYAAIEPELRALPRDEIVRRLDAAAVPCGPIRPVDDVLADPQVRSQDLVQEMDHPAAGRLRVTGAPYHFDGAPVAARQAPPLLGQQTREILTEAGYSADDIEALLASGAAAEPAG